MTDRTVRVAAAQYPIEEVASFAAYADKLERWVGEAARDGAQLLVFPEYGAMELSAFAGTDDLQQQLAFVSALRPRVDALHVHLAEAYGVHILAASLPEIGADGRARNVARLVAPTRALAVQEKLIMTRFEREIWGITGGAGLRLFDTALGRIGVLICYDSEFPLLARALVAEGAQILLVPSCTDSAHGYSRVRVAAQARALEGQCVVVQAPTVGLAHWSPAVDVNVGAAGVFGPPDLGFPPDGVLALGVREVPCWVHATIDLDAIDAVRREGAVFNLRHWAEQPGADGPLPAPVVVSLR